MIRIVKFLKRLTVDVPRDISHWVRFYSFRRFSYQSDLHLLGKLGHQEITNLLSQEDIVSLKAVAKELYQTDKFEVQGQLRGRIFAHGLIDPRLTPIINKFKKVATAYLNSSSLNLELTYFQKSWPARSVEDIPGGAFHMDDNKPNIKFFVYLNDVGPLNGPLKVIPKSHGLMLTKLGRFLQWSLFKSRSALYAGSSANLEGIKAVKVLGGSGFCCAVDTTAWHMAEPVKHGERDVFVCSFNLAGS